MRRMFTRRALHTHVVCRYLPPGSAGWRVAGADWRVAGAAANRGYPRCPRHRVCLERETRAGGRAAIAVFDAQPNTAHTRASTHADAPPRGACIARRRGCCRRSLEGSPSTPPWPKNIPASLPCAPKLQRVLAATLGLTDPRRCASMSSFTSVHVCSAIPHALHYRVLQQHHTAPHHTVPHRTAPSPLPSRTSRRRHFVACYAESAFPPQIVSRPLAWARDSNLLS
jgi:hypothetical protein